MSGHFHQLLRAIVFVVGLSASFFSAASELNSPHSHRLQATFSYQFLKFVAWEPPRSVNRFVFCVLSNDRQLTGQLQTLNNRNSLWGNILVISYPNPPTVAQFSGCGGVYIDTGYPYHSLQPLIVQSTVLTLVKDDIDRVGLGVFIFFIENKKLRFKVNLKRARSKGIRVGASLLLLAAEVIEY